MIEINYKLERIENGEVISSYNVPKEIQAIPRFSVIEAPNSSGKSTLFHIISIAFGGTTDKSIPDSLKTKMKNLLDRNHHNLEFEIKIFENDEVLLRSWKSKMDTVPNIECRIMNSLKVTNLINFKEKFKLIYDIPEDPIGRLNAMIPDIKFFFSEIMNKLKHFLRNINDLQKELKKYDKEILNKKKKKLEENSELMKRMNLKLDKDEKFINDLEKAFIFKYYRKYEREKKECEKDIKILEKDERKLMKAGTQKKSNLNAMEIQLKSSYVNLKSNLYKILEDLDGKIEKKQLIELKEIEFLDYSDNKTLPNNFKENLGVIEECLNEKQKEIPQEDIKKIKLFSELLKILENYKKYEIEMPGKIQLKIFMSDLEKNLKDLHNIQKKNSFFSEKIKNINEIKKTFIKTEEKLEKYHSKRIEYTKADLKKQENIIDDLLAKKKKECKKITNVFLQYEKRYNILGRPVGIDIIPISTKKFNDYQYLDEKSLEKAIRDFKNTNSKKHNEINNLKSQNKDLSKDIEDMEEKGPHKYQKHEEKIKSIREVAAKLTNSYEEKYVKFFDDIQNKNVKKLIREEKLKFFEIIFSFLGKRIKQVKHEDKIYEIKSMDLIKEEIITSKGEKIRFIDMGTGQSQSAYLRSKLTTTDNKKIIALFDEISNMDNKSLELLYSKINENFLKKKQLICLLNQPDIHNQGVITVRSLE
ncbi:hypothetical protein DSAG12_03020 [Promethearchaeum syntrophicum]|uniref:Rad50/SbcC-type AAA domain-containing protein n=1 Tax=Promethearchaeum syntrophicum TaxID=2594042 RepID=A0A5B9DD71_9ARCH|nr:hypothetical protein [Candidatus Prometheoarchaeum syntrophicum]